MATFLYRLGRAAYGRRRTVLLAWVLLLAVLGGIAAGFAKGTTTTLTIPGVESIKAADLLQERFPASGAGGAAGRIVFAAPGGRSVTDPAAKTAIEKTVTEAGQGDERRRRVRSVPDQGRSRRTAGSPTRPSPTPSLPTPSRACGPVRAPRAPATPRRPPGCRSSTAGRPSRRSRQTSSAEGLGVLVALLVLTVTFGSLLAAGLPLVTALVGVATGMAGVYALTSVLDLTSTAPTLGLMLGLAVGIDYALFIITRHRENLAAGLDPQRGRGPRGRDGGQRGRVRRRHGDDRPGRPLGRRHPVPDHDGSRGRRHRRDRRARRPHPGAGPPRLRGRARSTAGRSPACAVARPRLRHPTVVRQPLGHAVTRKPLAFLIVADRRRRHRRAARAEAATSACPTTAPSRPRPPSARPTTCSPRASAPASTAR